MLETYFYIDKYFFSITFLFNSIYLLEALLLNVCRMNFSTGYSFFSSRFLNNNNLSMIGPETFKGASSLETL